MGRSFGLKAYRAFSQHTSSNTYEPSQPRPKGQLVWIHAPENESLLAIEDLARRLCAARYDLSIVITVPSQNSLELAPSSVPTTEAIVFEKVPSEHPDSVSAFMRHWAPDMGLWAWGDLRPNLVAQAHAAGCPMILIDADEAGFDSRRDRWFPDLTRNLLRPFAGLMVRSSETLRRLEALGLSTAKIDFAPPLEAGGRALPCDDGDLDELSKQLKGRPVWFASNVENEEYSGVLKAHRQAMQLSHRLLLVLHPANSETVDSLQKAIAKEEFRYINWSNGGECDDGTQVILATDHSDLGLFYRASPVSFMGGSLSNGVGGRNPFDAAALGSAVLYGPNVNRFFPFYERLTDAGAAKMVRDARGLGSSIAQLIAPDKAAAMAHAGWDVISQGADLTDRVIDLVQSCLDGELDTSDARA